MEDSRAAAEYGSIAPGTVAIRAQKAMSAYFDSN